VRLDFITYKEGQKQDFTQFQLKFIKPLSNTYLNVFIFYTIIKVICTPKNTGLYKIW
jgi:hypothetical protein